MTILQTIKSAVIRLLHQQYPSADIYGEEIRRTVDGESLRDSEWAYVDVQLVRAGSVNAYQTELNCLVLVDYHHPEETNSRYLQAGEDMDWLFRPVLAFTNNDEQRYITVQGIEQHISERILHVSFPLAFVIDRLRETADLMGALSINGNGADSE